MADETETKSDTAAAPTPPRRRAPRTTSKAKAFQRPEPKELVGCPAGLVAAYARTQGGVA